MMKKPLSLMLLLIASICLPACTARQLFAAESAPETLSGRVFLDANNNGIPDPGEKGIPDVRVTDGINFVTTAADGSYSINIADDYIIPYRPARTVAVSWPTGKWPTAKWWVRLSDVADPKNVNFALRDDEQSLPFAFVHMSDDHGAGKMYTEHYAPDVAQMRPLVKFCFNTGDMGYATLPGAEDMFRSIQGHLAKFPVPVFVSPGNHDHIGEDKDAPMAKHPLVGWGAQTKYLGPVRWSFDYAGVRFVGIDYMEKTDKGYKDQVPHVAVQWLEKDLASVPKDSRVILLVHCYDASQDFYDTLRKGRITYVCVGHTHTPTYARIGGVPVHTNFGLAIGVVTRDAIDVSEGSPRSFGPTVLFGYFRNVVCPAMEQRRVKQHNIIDKDHPLQPASAAAESAEILFDFTLGAARKVGLKFGRKDTIDITFDGKTVNVAGAPFPFVPDPKAGKPDANVLKWHILMDKDRLTLFVENYLRVTKAVKVDEPATVTFISEYGPDGLDHRAAAVKRSEVWELRPVRDGRARGLHHFAPPAWVWGTGQLTGACLEDTKNPAVVDILKRYSPDGVTDYGSP